MDQYNRKIVTESDLSFEDLKKYNQHGIEYWSARDLQPLLGYAKWQQFESTIKKAIESCKQSGNSPNHHFTRAGKPILGGKGAIQIVEDYYLSRFACYLIAQNGDPRKPKIAQAQNYFAAQTPERNFRSAGRRLREVGVQSSMFGTFHDAGYKGLYGGLGVDAIKARKGIKLEEQLMDWMNTTELAANLFRMTQTRDKLEKENIKNQKKAIETYEAVGKRVRAAIEEIGGILPENIPPVESIKFVKKRLKQSKPQDALEAAGHPDSEDKN